jgi:hypothetical protein
MTTIEERESVSVIAYNPHPVILDRRSGIQ